MAGVHNVLAGASGGFGFAPTINSPVNNYNIRTAALAAGWDGTNPLIATITVNAVVGSNSTGSYAFDTDLSYPSGSSLSVNLTASGKILGKGGNGGAGNPAYEGNGSPGSAGGPAFRAQYAVTVTNSGIVGGGGGGGGGAGVTTAWLPASGTPGEKDYFPGAFICYGGGGGGGGTGSAVGTGATGGSGSLGGGGTLGSSYPSYPGANGTETTGGAGGAGYTAGGAGGGLGAAGSTGSAGAAGCGNYHNGCGGAGGAAGACATGLSFINGGAGISGTTYGGQA
jgi:hypothetical protein